MRVAPIFTIFTIPKLVMRVPRLWLAVCALAAFVGAEGAILIGLPAVGVLAAAFLFGCTWTIGYLLTRFYDAEFINIIFIKYIKINATKTPFPEIFKGNRYSA